MSGKPVAQARSVVSPLRQQSSTLLTLSSPLERGGFPAMRFLPSIGAAVAAGLALACGPSTNQMQEIQNSLQDISTRLQTIETLLAPLRAAAQPRQQEDFNKVYEIAVGDSPIKGNPNAPVTLVEYS